MLTPTVIEIPRKMDAVGRDTFIDGAGASTTRSRPLSRLTGATVRSIAPAQAQITRRGGARPTFAAQRAARGSRVTTLLDAA